MTIQNQETAERRARTDLDRDPQDHSDLAPVDGLSYVRGPSFPPLTEVTIAQLLHDTAAHYGSREALVFPDHRLTYAEMAQAVDALAAGFLALGLEKGDRLGIWSPNRLEWVLTQFATARIGVILVNINPAYRPAELEYALNLVGCKALVLARAFKTSDYLQMIRTLAPELDTSSPGKLRSETLPDLRHVILMGDTEGETGVWAFDDISPLGNAEHHARLTDIASTLSPEDAINIQFTSGTTGRPKGATLSHRNIINNARFVMDRITITHEDKLALPVPLYHCFGMSMGVMGAVNKGAAMIFTGEAFDAAVTLDVVARERCTSLYGVPTMFVQMLQELEKTPRDLSSLRTGIMAGSPCPVKVMKQVNDRMNMKEVTISYGMTETSPVSIQSFVDDTVAQRCETVGRVHPHLEVKIVDENGQIVPVGTQGELCTKGYSVMKGYWNDPERTQESIRDGWMHTGDLAVFDEAGFCTITGRVKDMIIRGGENIYPREIEEFLFTHPQVSEVQVFGIPDERMGEVVCAWVVPAPGASVDPEVLRAFCKDQIAHFKIPTHFRLVDELPMTITGKPQKFVMRDMMVAELAAQDA